MGYVEDAEEMLREARKELRKCNVRQVARKVWGAAAALSRPRLIGKKTRKSQTRELWEHKRVLVKGLGKWVSDARAQANTMHTCFYEGWCNTEDVEDAFGPCDGVDHLISVA